MFRVRAEFRDELEIAAACERVREFFSDLRNFSRLVPGIEGITEESNSVMCLRVSVEVALIGMMQGDFRLIQVDSSSGRIEWGPAPTESQNLLRYAVSFEATDASTTKVRVAQRVELRRNSSTELHLMAGLLGEKRIGSAVEYRLGVMMRTFLERARIDLINR
jgi:carbon monoxide dehydrogenase subunit G